MEHGTTSKTLDRSDDRVFRVGLDGPVVKLPGVGDSFDFGGLGVQWKIDAAETGRGFSVIHHPMAPKALAAPLHRHHRRCPAQSA